MENNGGFLLVLFLTLIFFVLKVTEKIAWSWVWVLSPLWIYFSLGFMFFVVFLTFFFIRRSKQNESNSK
jgi:heme/copper-type cytochrome/quinol oxidase subunit 4